DIDVCVDGEMIRGDNFKVEILPAALKLVIPQ
ncbi:MAG: lipid kinase YegS, partial [Bacilli bacterium]|nr:lipid kinase YegS [Bacilli bacterium]